MYLFPSWWFYNNDISGYNYKAQDDCVISEYLIRKNIKGSGHDVISAKIEAFDWRDSVKPWKTSVRRTSLWDFIWTPTKWKCHPLNGEKQELGINMRINNKWTLEKQGSGQVLPYFLLFSLYCILVLFVLNKLLCDDSQIINYVFVNKHPLLDVTACFHLVFMHIRENDTHVWLG